MESHFFNGTKPMGGKENWEGKTSKLQIIQLNLGATQGWNETEVRFLELKTKLKKSKHTSAEDALARVFCTEAGTSLPKCHSIKPTYLHIKHQ